MPFDPNNDLLDTEEDDEDEEEDYEDDEPDFGDVDDGEEEDDFGLGVFPKSLFTTNNNNNNNPSSPTTTDARLPNQPPYHQQQPPPLLDDIGREAVPLPGPPRDLIAQIVRPRFVTLSWMEPNKNPDEVVSYDVFYKMTTSER